MLAALAAVLFLELSTPSFVAEYDSRPNRLFFEYLIYPREVAETLVAGYGAQLAAAAIIIAIALWLWARVVAPCARPPVRPLRLMTPLALTPLLLVVCLAAMRSSFDHRAVNPSMVALSRDPMVNDLALNSTYSVLYAGARGARAARRLSLRLDDGRRSVTSACKTACKSPQARS